VPNLWPVNLTTDDKSEVQQLAERRRTLGLKATFADTIRDAVKLAASASDDDLRKGEL
jgi:hypothetical protein